MCVWEHQNQSGPKLILSKADLFIGGKTQSGIKAQPQVCTETNIYTKKSSNQECKVGEITVNGFQMFLQITRGSPLAHMPT